MRRALAALIAPLAICSAVSADTIIDNSGATGGLNNPQNVVAQTFVVPLIDSTLVRFALEPEGIRLNAGSPQVSVVGHVVRWDVTTNTPVGPLLYSSPATDVSMGSSSPVWFEVGSLDLIPGGTFAFVGTMASGDDVGWGLRNSPGYASGYLVGSTGLVGGIWTPEYGYDMAFRAEFTAPTPIPEPSTLALLTLAVVGLFVVRRRRTRRCVQK